MASKLIGLLGAPRSGKDEVSKVLVNKFGFTSIAFADLIKKEFGLDKEKFEALKGTPEAEKIRADLWAFSASKKKNNPLYFVTKTMDFIYSSSGPVVITEMRTPEELHAFFTYKQPLEYHKAFLVERSGIETFIGNQLSDSKLTEELIEEYAKAYKDENNDIVKHLHNKGSLGEFNGFLIDFFTKELEEVF